jgi:hypothetical protein
MRAQCAVDVRNAALFDASVYNGLADQLEFSL